MQFNVTFLRITGYLQRSLAILSLFFFLAGTLQGQVYTNGNLSTGPTASTGEPAPAGFTWSEVQLDNQNAGYAASISAGYSVADDFTVTGNAWTATKFTCYAYSTGYTGVTSPFTDVRVQIFNTNPSVGTPTPIFGDLTTNRFTASSSANMYRIFNGAPGTTRQIWRIEANINANLPAGTYWVEWQVGTALASNFSPASTVVGTTTQPGNNALQHTFTPPGWLPIMDGINMDQPQDMPFSIDYTTSVCSGVPTPGNTVASAASVCPTIPFTLSAQNPTGGSGVTYQWQSSPDGTNFTDITGATNNSLTTTLTANTFYQLVVTCSGGGSATSAPIQVSLTPASGCYCIPASTDCTDGDIITRVVLNTLDNPSGCGPAGFTNYGIDPAIVVPEIVAGVGNPISITAGGGVYTENIGVWIDADRNGSFDPGEFSFIGTTTGGTVTGNVSVPATALLGETRMRIRVRFNTALTGADACLPYTFGETEDYTVNIVACVSGVIGTQPVATAVNCSDDAIFFVGTTGSALQYQWQQQTGGTGPWVNIPGATNDTLFLTAVTVAQSGNIYRVVVNGGCTPVLTSDSVALTVGPLLIEVTPTSTYSCASVPNNAAVPLSITTIPGGSNSTSTNYASGAINIPIPDNDDVVGITHTVTVPVLPAGAVVTGASVTLNITHPYVGDLIIALKAPNGNILNLDYALGATGGPGVTTGFTNTVISSTGTAALNSGSDPWTGVFAPDAEANPVAGIPTAGTALTPSGANVFSFSDLYSVPNGDWVISMYDYASPDPGVLNNWTLTLTYSTAQVLPYAGVWSPLTGLYLNSAGTIPYTGTIEDTVFAAPSVTTIYSVVVTTPTCTSDPVSIPFYIGASLGAFTTQPDDITACVGNSVTFAAEASPLGTPVSYQWEVSTDGGQTYTDVPGATSNSYNVVAALAQNGNLFRLVISSIPCGGSIVSDAAQLTVVAPQTIAVTAAPSANIFPGSPTLLTAQLSPGSPTNAYQWYYNGVAIPGANSSTFNVSFETTGLGEFAVEVIDTSATAVCKASISAGITVSDSVTTKLFIYPNPNNGLFQVRYNDQINDILGQPRVMNIYDAKGSRVYSRSFAITGIYSRMDVDLSFLPKGIYVVDLTAASGRRLSTGRVLIR